MDMGPHVALSNAAALQEKAAAMQRAIDYAVELAGTKTATSSQHRSAGPLP
jgi:hypothetical protein